MERNIHMIECPRDAMQGWKKEISTAKKIEYINSLLQVGFHTLDCGSFVSPKAVPQMADSAEVFAGIDNSNTHTKLLCIVANERGAQQAVSFENITYLGFPFSISPTFQLRNANSTIEESWGRVLNIRDLCVKENKQLVIYLSMGFGNPYGDAYDESIVLEWADKMYDAGIRIISVADTVGLASAGQVSSVLNNLIPKFPAAEIGVHLHSRKENWKEKVEAAFNAGCDRFDGALKGIGGCPMANDELVGNIDTELLIEYFVSKKLVQDINSEALAKASARASEIFY